MPEPLKDFDDRLSLLPWPDSVISVCHPVTSGL